MNEQQQELYEKLLKKVNEFCLGTEKVSPQVYKTIQMYKQLLKTYQDSIKVLEIIKHHYSLDIYKGNYYLNGARICEEEYKL